MDRANIHFKIGPFIDVPFSADEQLILDRFTANKSFDDVIALARELYDAAQEDMQNDDQGETEQGEGEAKVKLSTAMLLVSLWTKTVNRTASLVMLVTVKRSRR